jgi:hypothetical protein
MVRFQVLLVLAAVVGYPETIPLDSANGLQARKVNAEPAAYKGRKAVRVTDALREDREGNEDRIAILPKTEFQNGTIEIDLAGQPGPGAAETARGFTGVAFRVSPGASQFECFYLRPTNGRADDQLRRNHSLQYFSFPEFPWYRLRKETPAQYESYADLVPGEWTHVKIEVDGAKAKLYINGAPQASLLVNDLKHGESKGSIALWIGPGTVAYFSNLRTASR